MDWYVVQAYSGYENQVKRFLEERIREEQEEEGAAAKDFGDEPDILVPSEKIVELHGNQRRSTEKKFFPGCLLVRMDMNDKSWHLVRSTPWVMGFIGGTAKNPAPIRKKEIDAIQRRLEGKVETQLFSVGEIVRITDGPFSGFSGTVEKVDSAKQRLNVLVSIFGRTAPVEIEFKKVEKG